ncbi:DUF636 domain protein [Cutaneotrichosporon oleaginosum]|uniref:DUF636 domain protein n=1 Tax=Cutaneotrichosporon oleaginosum TaxID=879819 RepID=A0A0J0XXH7_9TREE|nr:DUF636 domain protein [Cutaneotrichosporon oleaginosum]KLT45772.1 DUF636 domain protein [Cutaneotrichosporon oleaginosum]TXT04464.1 hypothetical protein COLE_07283 [Cutaneotrichosporon oleaginosum]
MPMLLEGSCHCRKVKYTLESHTPVPYQLCQCSICRKVGGYMGSVNIMGNAASLKFVRGEELLVKYKPVLEFGADDTPQKTATSERVFCSVCSAALWNYHPEYPEWIYPFASTIDTQLPKPAAQHFVILRSSCPAYVPTPEGFDVYDDYGPAASGSIESWHKKNGCWVE